MLAPPEAVGGLPARAAARVGRPLPWILLAAVLFMSAVTCFAAAFCTFNPWDDEGYFLLALRAYREHGGLYETIRTVFYGPIYFQMVTALFDAVGRTADNAGARWFMLSGWLAAASSAAWVAWRSSRSVLAAAVTIAVVVPILVTFTNEPLHATSPILLLLAPLLILVAEKFSSERRPGPLVLATCGALCAAVALIKLNVGVFCALAFLGTCIAFPARQAGRGAALVRSALALVIVALPFGLMQALLADEKVLDFALLVSIAAAPFALELLRKAPQAHESWGRRELLAFIGGGAALATTSIALVHAHGTTFAGLWRGLITDAAAFPLLNHSSPALPPRGQILLCALPLLGVLLLRPRPSVLRALQCTASLCLLAESVLVDPQFHSLPLTWLACGAWQASRPRAFFGLLSVLLALQGYPIPGCQLGLFALVAALVGVTGLWESACSLPWTERGPPLLRRLASPVFVLGCIALLALANPVWKQFDWYRTRWSLATPLGLPGTAAMRLSESQSARFAWLAANVRNGADTFVGVPGVHSLYFWSGLEPPLVFYPHHWLLFRRAEEEEALAHSLDSSARICVVVNPSLIAFWTHADLPDGPVKRVLDAKFELAGGFRDCALLFPKSSERHELVLTARDLEGQEQLLARFGADRAFQFTLPVIEKAHIARFVLFDTSRNAEVIDSATNKPGGRLIITNPAGEELLVGPRARPLDTSAPLKVFMFEPPHAGVRDTRVLLVRACSPSGRVVARILFQPGS